MRNRRQTIAMLAILALAAALVAGFGSTIGNAKTTAMPMTMSHDGHGMQMTSAKSSSKAVALRITLDRLLGAVGEHLVGRGLDEYRPHRADMLRATVATLDASL